MNKAGLRGAQQTLAQRARKRFDERAGERERKLREVEERGVLMAAGMTSALRRVAHMTVGEGRILEARLGETDDLAQINYLPRGQRASRAVCRLLRDGEWFGTGFLVAPGLLLTNNHVIESDAEAERFTAEFGRELDVDDQPASPIVTFALDARRAFVTSPFEGGLDFTFVAVRPASVDGLVGIERFGWLPMDERRDKILEGEPCVIIQHPLGEPKQICLFGSELVDRPGDFIQYMTDTDHGASGSPVHNRHWQLIGLHHASTTTDQQRRGHRLAVNEGIRVSSMIRALRDVTHGLAAADGVAPDKAAAAVLAKVTDPRVVGDGRPMAPPVTIVADPLGGVAAEALEARPTVIGRRPTDHFDGRPARHHGYKEAFLGRRHPVRLPRLMGPLEDDAARLIGDRANCVLHYTHYATIQSTSRRMPIVTAVNIDGARSQRLDRKDRSFESRERLEAAAVLEAAADKWFFDPRIDESAQLTPPVYDKTAFAFGHVTRREDPVWGDLRTARMANDDTFYMTNCATQHERFNSGIWLSLENAILGAARRGNGVKITVLSGPVFLPDDPEVLGVPVPTAFWKIVAWVEGGALHARGYMQSQRTLVNTILQEERRRLEALPGLASMEPFEVAIADIARMTSLDFGVLVAADEKTAAGPESRRGTRLSQASVDSLARSLARATRADDDEDDEYPGGSVGGDRERLRQLIADVVKHQDRLKELLDEGR
jgi:endonuclease G, mitochondrial